MTSDATSEGATASSAGGARATRRWVSWLASILGGAAIMAYASRHLEIVPSSLTVPNPWWLVAAVALQVPYGLVRAIRIAPLLEASAAADLQEGAGEREALVDRRVIMGSGLVAFLVVMVLPLRLGEAARPLLLARSPRPGHALATGAAVVALERVLDGLFVVLMLFVGLLGLGGSAGEAGLEPAVSAAWQASGQSIGCLFAALLLLVFAVSRSPHRLDRLRAWTQARARWTVRVWTFAMNMLRALTPIWSAGWGALWFLVMSAGYWLLTALQMWMTMRACGIEAELMHAVLVVAVVGLSLQLPAGPAQLGSFQLGMAGSVALLGAVPGVAAGGASFAAIMYLLSLFGAVAMALVGAGLLRPARDQPLPASAPRPNGPRSAIQDRSPAP